MTRFWLIRHGEPTAEARGRCYGSLDIDLSENGRAQMAQVAEFLQAEPVDAIFASPLSRAVESARIVASAQCCSLELEPDLQEMRFGEFEGLTYDEIAALYPDIYRQWMETPTQVRFPNGETFSEMRLRVLKVFDKIRHERQNQTVAIVSHGGVNRILLAWALKIPDDFIFRLAQDYAAINLLTITGELPTVLLANYRPGQAGSSSALG
jgi:alpha-ribazole phosphatase